MSEIEPLACGLFPVADGVLVVPAVLPIHVPAAAYAATVGEWLDVAELEPS